MTGLVLLAWLWGIAIAFSIVAVTLSVLALIDIRRKVREFNAWAKSRGLQEWQL